MGIRTGEMREDADGQALEDEYERALEDAYAEAAWMWSEAEIERIVFGSDADLGESGFDEHARARIEEASPTGLVYRLQDETSPFARGPRGSGRFRTVGDTLDLLRAADRLASWVAARQAVLTAEVYHKVRDSEVHGSTVPGAASGIVPGAASGTGRVDPRFSFMLAAQEIAPLLRVPGRTASRLLGEALRLTEDLPGTWEALDEGRINPAQAQVIVEESGSIPADAVPGFETTVLETAGALTRPKLTRRCRRLREELHPESITARKARAVKDRDVTVQPEHDGMAWLGAYLPAEQAHGIFNRVDAAARSLQDPEELRTLSQLRADVFADVLTHTCTGDPKRGTGFRGIGASVFVTVPVMTLLGHTRADWQNPHAGAAAGALDDSSRRRLGDPARNGDRRSSDCAHNNLDSGTADYPGGSAGVGGGSAGAAASPGTSCGSTAPDLAGCENGLLDGYGPIDPETARNLAAHAPSFTRILVHPENGAVLSVGRDRYRPPKHLQDWVRIKNPTCIHPGCNRSTWSCEIDHLTPWAHGGKTALNNLEPRCKLHHMMKTEGIWPAGQEEDGTPHVTSLGGKTYTTLPEPPPPF